MEDFEKNELVRMVLAPYIQKSTALRGKSRHTGGNQFRHAICTFGILLDYHCIDPVILKASFIHDIFEDTDCVHPQEIIDIDSDGRTVYELVMEVTKAQHETKEKYLERLLNWGSKRAKVLKCADRISNLTDLHPDILPKAFIERYLNETRKFILPMAREVNPDMFFELQDLIRRRETYLDLLS